MVILKKLFLLTLGFFIFSCLYSLDPEKLISQYMLSQWLPKDGLPQSTISSIAQSEDGYIWFGTQEGLVKFDGIKFIVFEQKKEIELQNINISAIYKGPNNAMYIGTFNKGLFIFANNDFLKIDEKNGLPERMINCLTAKNGKKIWMGTSNGIYYLENKKIFNPAPLAYLKKFNIKTLSEDKDGNLFIGTENDGIFLFNNRELKKIIIPGLSSTSIQSLYAEDSGKLWIGTNGGGLNIFDGDRVIVIGEKEGLGNNIITFINKDSSGAIWVGTYGGGVSRFYNGRQERLFPGNGLSSGIVISFFEDTENNIWLGTYDGGLNKLSDGKFTSYSDTEGLSAKNVRTIIEDSRGRIWAGTFGGGVNCIENKKVSHIFNKKNGLSNDIVRSVCEDGIGRIWVGTYGAGIIIIDNNKIVGRLNKANGLSSDLIMSIYMDRKGRIWVGTSGGGLNCIDNGRITTYSSKNILANDVVRSTLEDSKGTIWFGTEGAGVYVMRDGKIIGRYTTAEGLSFNIISTIYEDQDGNMWFGTFGGGLNLLYKKNIYNFTIKNGFHNNVVYIILEDKKGIFWISCNQGVFSVSRNELIEYALKNRSSFTTKVYGSSDGMRSSECNGGNQPAGWKSKNGDFMFPTLDGIISINAEHININRNKPRVLIEKLIADQEEVALDKTVKLAPGKKHFEIHYTAFNFRNPAGLSFKYKLEGFDEKWIDVKNSRIAYYTNLPPGEKNFKVMACNSDGFCSEKAVELKFYLKPFFYQTWFFYLLCLILFLAATYGIFVLRVKQLENKKAELEKIIEEKTRELKEASLKDPLTGLWNRRFVKDIVAVDSLAFMSTKKYLLKNEGKRRGINKDTVLGIYILDIDHFKNVNDTYGHAAGDEVLKQFTLILASLIRKDDVIVRWGGEEFLVVLKNTDKSYLDIFAEKILSTISAADFQINLKDKIILKKTCSAGYAQLPLFEGIPDVLNLEQTIALADLGLYHAKHSGRNMAVRIEAGKSVPAHEEFSALFESLDYDIEKSFVKIKCIKGKS